MGNKKRKNFNFMILLFLIIIINNIKGETKVINYIIKLKYLSYKDKRNPKSDK